MARTAVGVDDSSTRRRLCRRSCRVRCVQPGTIENPGVRAAGSRPYSWYVHSTIYFKNPTVSSIHRHRAGQGTNVLVQALCVIVRRHCRPGGLGNYRIRTMFVASLKKPPAGKQAAFWIYRVSLEDRYLRTISATLNTMAWSNWRRSRPVSFLIFSRRYTRVLR